MRIVSLILALTMSLYLAGCGKSSKNESSSPQNNIEQTTADNLQEDDKKQEKVEQQEDKQQKTDTVADNNAEQTTTEPPSEEELDIFNEYLEQVQSDEKSEEDIQKEIAEDKGMTPEEVKKVYLKVWQHKLEQAEKLSQ